MSVYDFRRILKFLFNLAIIIIIGRLFYAPFDEKLAGTNLIYILPVIGILCSYLYLSSWFGWKKSVSILLYITGYIVIMGYFLLKHLLPKWIENAITILTLTIIIYLSYRIINRIIKIMIYRYQSFKIRMKSFKIRSKRSR